MIAKHVMSRRASIELGAKAGEQGVGEQPQRAIAGDVGHKLNRIGW